MIVYNAPLGKLPSWVQYGRVRDLTDFHRITLVIRKGWETSLKKTNTLIYMYFYEISQR